MNDQKVPNVQDKPEPKNNSINEQGYPRSMLRGADMLVFAGILAVVVSILPVWDGSPPTHTMFTAALVFNVVGYQFGFLPTLYPSSWYADQQPPQYSRVNPPVKHLADTTENSDNTIDTADDGR
jgi:hypothetical protein